MGSKFSRFLVLLLVLIMNFSYAQEKTISGTVSDQRGTLPGVNVTIKGVKRSTQTDFNGKYSIQAQTGEVLVFTFLGMKTFTATVGNSSVVNVKMEEEMTTFNEVIVTNSYNKGEKRSKVTGSIATVAAKQIENRALASFDQILQGQAAGVTVQSGSGQPGSSAKVRIRGTSSINGVNEPLYILDGVPITTGDFASLNANDFESVSLLKDASATSIYGSRASTGVIVITSKKGKYNSDTQFTYRSQLGFSKVGEAKFKMMNSEELLNFQRYVKTGVGGTGGANDGPLTDEQIAELSKTNTNWRDVFFRTGVTNTQEISMRGGTENTRFFNSLSYFDQEGISIRSGLKRFTLRSNIENKPSETSLIGVNISLNFSKQNLIDSEGAIALQNPYAAAYLAGPFQTVFNPDGTYNVDSDPSRVGGVAYENLKLNQRYNNQVKAVVNLFAEKQIVKNLTARVDFGVDFSNDFFVTATDPKSQFGLTTEPGNAGSYSESSTNLGKFNTTSKIVYNNTFAEKHDFEAAVYLEYYKSHGRTGNFEGYGINPALVGYPEGITPGTGTSETAGNGLSPIVGGSDSENGLLSYFSVVKYGYDDRFKLDLSLRRDASNKFADANKWGTFWSAGANWNIMNEKFMTENNFFQTLILRASIGTTGNQAGIGSFQKEATWGTSQYGGNPSIVQTSVPNPELQWEEGMKKNIGFDFSILNDRLSGTVEYYNNYTSELFIEQTLPLESGLGKLDVNAGTMSNKGVDISIEGFLVKKDNLSFSLYGNFNYNKNRIEDLKQVDEYPLGTSIVREGLPFGSHYAVEWAGVNPANGQPLYYDLNGNITNQYSDSNNVAKFGSYEPVYSGGFGSRFNYKGLELSTLFTFAAEYFRFNNQSFFQENPNFAQYNQSTIMLTMWKNPGDITEVQSNKYQREFSSKDIEDASYLRLKNITIGYNFPKVIFDRIKGISGVRVYAQAENLVTWTKFTGFDPEDDNNIATYEYPTPRIVTFGVDVKF
jgi:TonB-linked SusC/RagA family outer membrane protein